MKLWWLVLLLCPLLALADTETAQGLYGFETAEQEARFRQLSSELRCPKCQNQAIGDSDAPIAQDMREQVVDMIREGRTDREIVDFFIARYGEFVTYHPRLTAQSVLLWGVPMLVLMLGLVVVVRQVLRSRGIAPDEEGLL